MVVAPVRAVRVHGIVIVQKTTVRGYFLVFTTPVSGIPHL